MFCKKVLPLLSGSILKLEVVGSSKTLISTELHDRNLYTYSRGNLDPTMKSNSIKQLLCLRDMNNLKLCNLLCA